MKKYISKKWTFVLILFTIICLAYLSESEGFESYAAGTFGGGNIVCYDQCISSENTVSLTFPLISAFDVTKIEFDSLDSIVNNYVNCRLDFKELDKIIYNKYRIYYFTLNIVEKPGNQCGYNNPIKGISININGSDYYYDTPNFKLFNCIYLSNSGEYSVNNGELVLTDHTLDNLIVDGKMISKRNIFTSVSEKTIISMTPSAFYTFQAFSINSSSVNSQNINTKISTGSPFQIDYTLGFIDEQCSSCIVKSALIIKYVQNGTSGIYVSNAPFYTYPGSSIDTAAKKYIDTLL